VKLCGRQRRPHSAVVAPFVVCSHLKRRLRQSHARHREKAMGSWRNGRPRRMNTSERLFDTHSCECTWACPPRQACLPDGLAPSARWRISRRWRRILRESAVIHSACHA
jgi:hypothetical protein